MKIPIILFYLLSLFLIYGCGKGLGEWSISSLYAQKIEGTSKILYKYDAWGGRDSNANGFIILDSTESFKIDLPNELPFYNLSEIPNKINIEGVTHDCYNSCGDDYYKSTPIFKVMKTENDINNDINIITRIYQYRGYSEKTSGLERYVFESFKETRDSLFFFDLNDVESMNGQHLDELKVKKGEIYLIENKNNEIEKIFIKEIKLANKTKEFVHDRDVFLTPKHKTNSSQFSERGIFREVKISQK